MQIWCYGFNNTPKLVKRYQSCDAIKAKDFDSHQVGFEEGLGIVGFLKWKKFFITGGTGFLAKGIVSV